MNFKPTLWKSIVSILTIIIFDIFLTIIISIISAGNCVINNYTGEVFCRQVWSRLWVIIPSLIAGIIIYIIWSLFEKNKKRRK